MNNGALGDGRVRKNTWGGYNATRLAGRVGESEKGVREEGAVVLHCWQRDKQWCVKCGVCVFLQSCLELRMCG